MNKATGEYWNAHIRNQATLAASLAAQKAYDPKMDIIPYLVGEISSQLALGACKEVKDADRDNKGYLTLAAHILIPSTVKVGVTYLVARLRGTSFSEWRNRLIWSVILDVALSVFKRFFDFVPKEKMDEIDTRTWQDLNSNKDYKWIADLCKQRVSSLCHNLGIISYYKKSNPSEAPRIPELIYNLAPAELSGRITQGILPSKWEARDWKRITVSAVISFSLEYVLYRLINQASDRQLKRLWKWEVGAAGIMLLSNLALTSKQSPFITS